MLFHAQLAPRGSGLLAARRKGRRLWRKLMDIQIPALLWVPTLEAVYWSVSWDVHTHGIAMGMA